MHTKSLWQWIAFMTIAIMLPAGAFAQGFTQTGIKAGVNLANIHGEGAPATHNFLGFNAGGFLTYHFTPILAVQPEIQYTRKGAELQDGTFLGVADRSLLKLDYIELPVLMKVTPWDWREARPSFFIGPALAYNLRAEADRNIAGINGTVNLRDEVHNVDLGGVLGAGANFRAGQSELRVDARYTLGMVDVMRNTDQSVRNGVFTISLGYGF